MRRTLGDGFWWFYTLGTLAGDEQQRSGHPEIDYEHVLVALSRTGGPVGELLTRHGLGTAALRSAFAQVHAERIAALGIAVPGPQPARTLTRTPPDAMVWSDRALQLAVGTRDDPDQPAAVLRLLLADPTDHVRDAVRAAGVSPAALLTDLATLPPTDLRDSPDLGDGWLRTRTFMPTQPSVVLSLVSDPQRWLEWNREAYRDAQVTGTRVRAHRVATRWSRLAPRTTRQPVIHELVPAGAAVTWRRTSTGTAGREHVTSITLTAEPDGAGALVTIGQYPARLPRMLAPDRAAPPSRIERFAVRAALRSTLADIARAVRENES